jgi:hypothetical protein
MLVRTGVLGDEVDELTVAFNGPNWYETIEESLKLGSIVLEVRLTWR